jgi:hypothetical protein
MSAIVCGFRDAEGGLAGLAWTLGGASGGLVTLDGARTEAGEAEVTDDGKATTVRIETPGGTVDAELKPRTAPVALEGAGAEAAPGRATVRVDGGRKLKCEGHLTRWDDGALASGGLLRHVAVPAAEEAVLFVIARGDAGAPNHADEAASAWLVAPDGGVVAYPEALVSTQYDGAGTQTRVGLELWPDEDDGPPMRAAGTALGDAARTGGATAVLLQTSAEGHKGVGGYLIVRGD